MLDCLVIGGGPGGLMTAVYMARFKRSCLVVDAGASRLGLYAVGDVAEGLNQISVAAGHAAIAATDIHNSL